MKVPDNLLKILNSIPSEELPRDIRALKSGYADAPQDIARARAFISDRVQAMRKSLGQRKTTLDGLDSALKRYEETGLIGDES